MLLSREAFIGKCNQPPQVRMIDIPGHGPVAVRALNGRDREALEAKILKARDANQPIARALIFVATVCDLTGKLLFLDSDIPTINSLDWNLLEQVADVAKGLNAMRPEDFEASEKNS